MTKDCWEIVGTIATCLAVIVALLPIYLSYFEKQAKARNLRMRIGVKLTMLKPSINALAFPLSKETIPVHVLFSESEIAQKVLELESMLKESEVLQPKEQDILSQAVANLEFMLPAMRAGKILPEPAQSIISIIEKAIEAIENNGILSGEPHKPWA